MTFLMRPVFLLITFCLASLSIGFAKMDPSKDPAQRGSGGVSIKGQFLIEEGYYFLRPEKSDKKLLLVAADTTVRSRLACLQPGDYFTGTATSLSDQHITIGSIEYVNLHSLLGRWANRKEVFEFSDFRNFYHWYYEKDTSTLPGPHKLHYALSPYGESTEHCLWKIFFIDTTQVTLGSLRWIDDSQIEIRVYDNETGNLTLEKRLYRSRRP